MLKQKRKSKQTRLLNILGASGYLSVFVQWFLVLIVFMPSIITSPVFKAFAPGGESADVPTPEPVVYTPVAEGSVIWPILGWIAFGLGMLMIIGLFYWIIARAPRSIAKTGQTITHRPAEIIAPIAAKQFHLKKRQSIRLADSIVFGLKLLGAIVPFIAMFFSGRVISAEAAVAFTFLSCILFAWSSLFFVAQYTLSHVLKIAYRSVK